jgi:hypothetical protein
MNEELIQVVIPPEASPSAAICDAQHLLWVLNLFRYPLSPLKARFNVDLRQLKIASNQGSLKTVLDQLIMHTSIPGGIISFLFELLKACLIPQVTWSHQFPRPKISVKAERLNCQFHPIVFQHAFDDPASVQDVNLETMFQRQLMFERGSLLILYELIRNEENVRIFPFCICNSFDIRNRFLSPFLLRTESEPPPLFSRRSGVIAEGKGVSRYLSCHWLLTRSLSE